MAKRRALDERGQREYQEIWQKCLLRSRMVLGKVTQARRYVCTRVTEDQLVRESRKYIDLICCEVPSKKQRLEIVQSTVENIHNYFNKGYLDYRKSVAEAEDYAAIEWQGQGSIVKDVMGREYIDLLGGYGVYNMGIRHPTVVKAVQAQLERMPLNSQELLEPLRGALASLLAQLAPGELQGCFFINNGTDAVEGAMKLARLYTGKPGFISTLGGFHGKSMGSLSLMGKAEYRKPFEPLLDNIHFVPYGDADALAQELKKLEAVGQGVAAVVVEPVQGEAGAIVPPNDYLPRVRQLCDKHRVLLVLDEVQTGMGRTGRHFACEHAGIAPDILCLGKALGGGVMPLSAFMATKKIWSVLEAPNPFIHSTTFGGNGLACAAGIAAINVMLEEKLDQQAARKGEYTLKRLQAVQARHPQLIREVRGKGLLIGVEFCCGDAGYEVAAQLFRRGVLVAGTMLNAKTVRIEPALNIPDKLLAQALDRLEEAVRQVSAQKGHVHRGR